MGCGLSRFWNNDVLQNTDGVLQQIMTELDNSVVKPLTRRATRATLSRSGRGDTET
jgi:very-short-patch-repair endonuclease